MGINPDYLNLIIEQAVQKALQTNQNTTNYYKTINKHKKCSKCFTVITTENHKKDRSVCKNCYNTNTLSLMKKRFGLLEENRSSKKDSSNKLDGSINIKNIDPDCLVEKFSELYNNEYDSIEQSQAAREHAREILNELLIVKAITKRQYNTLYNKC